MDREKEPRVRRIKAKNSGGSRAATKALRRQQLIDSTIDSIAKRGFSGTTLADVADGAALPSTGRQFFEAADLPIEIPIGGYGQIGLAGDVAGSCRVEFRTDA